MKNRIKILAIAIAILAFAVTLVAFGVHYEFHQPWSIKLFVVAFVLLIALSLTTFLLGKIGIHALRHDMISKDKKLFSVLIFGLVLLTACNSELPKQFCSELSQDCEISKDFVMIKVIQNNDSALDVYGRPLQQQKWYMYATQPGTIIDFEWNDNARCVTPQDLDVLVSGKEPTSILYKCKTLKVDTITNFPVYIYNTKQTSKVSQVITKIALLQTSGYCDIFNDGRGIKVT